MSLAQNVDPDEAARWLRGATSSGEPTRWAVEIVVAEYFRMKERAREVIDGGPADLDLDSAEDTASYIIAEYR